LKNWTEILLKPNDALETTIKVLQAGGRRIALVVDENKKLLGTVTDGDIRRALIKHITMDCSVTNVMNSSPSTALASDSSDLIMSKMKSRDLLSIPLVDKQGVLVGLETLQNLLENKRYDNPVFLMAGGFGKRLSPLTNDTPKPLLHVGSKPILETILNQFIENGFHNFYISTHYKAEMLQDYFGDGKKWGVTIEYIHEDTPLGTAGALRYLEDKFNTPFFVSNCDIILRTDYKSILDFHTNGSYALTLVASIRHYKIPYGICVVKNTGELDSIREKPEYDFLVNTGVYLIEPDVIKFLPKDSYFDMPDLIDKIKENKLTVGVFPVSEKSWSDAGQWSEYNEMAKIFNL